MTVDLAVIFAELEADQRQTGNQGYSIEQLAKLLGKSCYSTKKLVYKGLDNGSWEVVKRRIETRTGYWTTKDAYLFKGVE